MKKTVSYIWILVFSLVSLLVLANENSKKVIYVLDMQKEITKATYRQTTQAFEAADTLGAELILIHMNTYGGTVVDADSIRSRILNSKIPVHVFIDNNAASAGALISVACDSIYMRPGASIGAATVVNQTGQAMPDKFQSYMRSTMRATAEAKGKKTVVSSGDTTEVWHRDPRIAEAMVDPSVYIEGIIDTGKVLTFTSMEAIENGFCEGLAENIPEVLKNLGVEEYTIVKYEPSWIEKIIGFLVHPAISGLLIAGIIMGIWFEMQSPGIGFPFGVAVLAAILYFAPLYLEGLAANWEILLFIVGIILIAVEIFVIPGFGVAGVLGVIGVFVGLVLSLLNNVDFNFEGVEIRGVGVAMTTVLLGGLGGFILALYIGDRIFSAKRGMFKNMALKTVQNLDEGYVSIEPEWLDLKGKTGTAHTVLRPSGKVIIEGDVYDAVAEIGFIDKGEKIEVTKVEATQLYVDLVKNEE